LKQLRIVSLTVAATFVTSLFLIISAAQTAPELETVLSKATPLPDQPPVSSIQTDALQPVVRQAVKHDLSPPLRSIPPKAPMQRERVEIQRLPLPRQEADEMFQRRGAVLDPVLQDREGESPMPSPIQSFDGLGNGDNQVVVGFQLIPPDTQGDVGRTHYVQWVNLVFAIWDKSGNLMYGPAAGNTLWTGFGGPCERSNDGDPIALFDPLADRWFMAQFALPYFPDGPFYQCIAISTSSDPTGTWYRYAFEWENGNGLDVMNDYPKFGVWPDGYYMTTNQFSAGTSEWAGTGVAAFERAKMLKGQLPQVVYYDLGPSDWGGMLPSDFDGLAPPPAGAPNYFVEANADEWAAGLNDELHIYEFSVDWTNPPKSTFTRVARLPMAPFDGDMCGTSQDCIPQPGTTQKLDALADRLMHRLQYRNFGSYETLVSNLTVDADGADHAGIRWFELRKTRNAWSIFQQGTYAPDGKHRWMGSMAMDHAGNIALGYSVSSSSTFPSIRYAGRLATDPLGTLPQAETELAAGRSFQAGGNRWGDYSMMGLDPVDDCTFWYTQQYVSAPGAWGNWDTRIGSFRFPGCLGQTGKLVGVVQGRDTGSPIVGARVKAESSTAYATYSQVPDGSYRFEALPPGAYRVTAEAYGYQPQTFTGVDVAPGSSTARDFRLTTADTYQLSGTVTDAVTGWPLYASIEIDNYPGGTVWTDPQTGFYNVALTADIVYNLRIEAWVDGYEPANRDIGPLTGNQVEDFGLDVDAETCVAPGYERKIVGIYEPFEGGGLPPADWTIVDNVGNGQVWVFDDPGARSNLTGGAGDFAIVDSDNYGWIGQQETELRTPAMDFSALETVLLEFDTDYNTYTDNDRDDIADVDVSTDGGTIWTNVWQKTGSEYRGPAHEVVDISVLSGGQPYVVVRFHYYDAQWEWWWQVDNVQVGQNLGCLPQPGGLVVGNVYDDNTGDPLVGAVVAGDGKESATSVATPLDPDVDDAFYSLFSPGGSQRLTAAMDSGYGRDVQVVDVEEGDTILQNFHLPAGWLAYTPGSIDVTVQMGSSTTASLALSNQGGLPLEFEIIETGVGFQPGGSDHSLKVVIPGTELTYGPDARLAKRHTRFRPDISFVVEQVWRPTGNVEVLLLTPDQASGGDTSLIQSTLEAFPDLNVTLWDAKRGAPTGADLAAYEVVVVGNDYLWTAAGLQPEAVGDALADYIDAGGKVIDTLFVHDYRGWELGGRYLEESYSVFGPSTADMTATPYSLGTVYDPAHPIMAGVNTIMDTPTIGTGHQDVGVAPGAVRLADWSSGEVFVAYNEAVVGVNQMWYHGANWTGDVPELMHNAILYLARSDVDWLSADPSSGTLPADSQKAVSITLDAGALSVTQAGKYLAQLSLTNDTIYGNPAIPVTMTVVDEAQTLYLPIIFQNGRAVGQE
jgi:hypothetical protein